jgi:hypothetical protein
VTPLALRAQVSIAFKHVYARNEDDQGRALATPPKNGFVS